MNNQIDKENGIANRGNLERLKKLMKRANKGESLTIGFIGGSITQGSLSTQPTLCYAYHVFEWWKKTFPKSEFIYMNAGIGGTTSQFGVARVESDLLVHRPDFVITEFSVNDESSEHFLETYEGLIRKIYSSQSKPALLIVHNVSYHNGGNAQLQHARVGRHYEIPCISMQSSIYPEVVAGKIPNRDITSDDLHPNDKGHELVASVITFFLDKAMEELGVPEALEPDMPAAITLNEYENSTRYQNYNSLPVLNGFIEDKETQTDITDCFKNGWTAVKPGSSISFKIKGKGISVQYRKSVKQPAPIAQVIIDDDILSAKQLDANFDETWGDKLELETIVERAENKMHKVEIKLLESQEEAVVSFYLVSIIGAN